MTGSVGVLGMHEHHRQCCGGGGDRFYFKAVHRQAACINVKVPASTHRLPAAQQLHKLDAVGLQRQGHQLEGIRELRGRGGQGQSNEARAWLPRALLLRPKT